MLSRRDLNEIWTHFGNSTNCGAEFNVSTWISLGRRKNLTKMSLFDFKNTAYKL